MVTYTTFTLLRNSMHIPLARVEQSTNQTLLKYKINIFTGLVFAQPSFLLFLTRDFMYLNNDVNYKGSFVT